VSPGLLALNKKTKTKRLGTNDALATVKNFSSKNALQTNEVYSIAPRKPPGQESFNDRKRSRTNDRTHGH